MRWAFAFVMMMTSLRVARPLFLPSHLCARRAVGVKSRISLASTSSSSSSSEPSADVASTPYATEYHAPVMIKEIIEQLDRLASSEAPLTRVVDLTCGGGGHSEAFLAYLQNAGLDGVEVIGVDRDSDSKEEVRTTNSSYYCEGSTKTPTPPRRLQSPHKGIAAPEDLPQLSSLPEKLW